MARCSHPGRSREGKGEREAATVDRRTSVGDLVNFTNRYLAHICDPDSVPSALSLSLSVKRAWSHRSFKVAASKGTQLTLTET